MNFFEEYYSDKLPPRLTKLREKHKLTQTDVGNASQISQIEKGKRPIT
ncbi:TPA: helix-turn-helix transcriptional regulator, partial [Streptococcus suis]|nr:helix-turn-helix transcriptional regulator [Streptococcus suis]